MCGARRTRPHKRGRAPFPLRRRAGIAPAAIPEGAGEPSPSSPWLEPSIGHEREDEARRAGRFVPRSPDFASSEGVLARSEEISARPEDLLAPHFPSVVSNALPFEPSDGDAGPRELPSERRSLVSGRRSLFFASSADSLARRSPRGTSSGEEGMPSERGRRRPKGSTEDIPQSSRDPKGRECPANGRERHPSSPSRGVPSSPDAIPSPSRRPRAPRVAFPVGNVLRRVGNAIRAAGGAVRRVPRRTFPRRRAIRRRGNAPRRGGNGVPPDRRDSHRYRLALAAS